MVEERTVSRGRTRRGSVLLALVLSACAADGDPDVDGGDPGGDASVVDGGAIDAGEDPRDGGTSRDGGSADAGLVDAATSDGGSPPPLSGRCMTGGFCWEYPSLFGITLEAVWGASESDVWAVGYGGAIVHFDGTEWTIEPSPTRATLYAVHGTSASNVWIAGEAGTVLRRDGASWVVVDAGATHDLLAVATLSTGEVWVAGDREVRRFDGSEWSALTPLETPSSNVHLLARADDDVWLTSTQYVQHWDGAEWEWRSVDTASFGLRITSLVAAGADTYLFLWGESSPVFRWDSGESMFVEVDLPEAARLLVLNGGVVGASAADDVWVIGDRGGLHFDGVTWSIAIEARFALARGSWLTADAGVFVGTDGLIVERRADALVTTGEPASEGAGVYYNAGAYYGRDAEAEWVLHRGRLLRRRPAETSWTALEIEGYEIGPFAFFEGDLWFGTHNAGESSIVVYEGSETLRLAATDVVAQQWMNATWADPDGSRLLFASSNGVIERDAAGTFTSLGGGWTNAIDGDASEVWVVAWGGVVRRSVGSGALTTLDAGVDADLNAVHYVSPTEVWIGGDESTLLRWDGSFHAVDLPALRFGNLNYRAVYSIAGSIESPHGLWVLVSGGEIVELHADREPVVHSLHFDGTHVEMATPDELVVVGNGRSVVRRRF